MNYRRFLLTIPTFVTILLIVVPSGAQQCGPQPPYCATCDTARAFVSDLPIAQWCGSNVCPSGLQQWFCDVEHGFPVPDACMWVDGLMANARTLCCDPTGTALDLGCAVDTDCPESLDECYQPWCSWTGQCLLVPTVGLPCTYGTCQPNGLEPIACGP
jgi:hypothetical protein